jgi:hypothetical protein
MLTTSGSAEVETLEREGDRLFQRLGYYGFMVLVGVALPLSSVIGSLIFGYGLVRGGIIAVRLARTVLALRKVVRG